MSTWDETREAKLKELWEKGHTASQIAEILGGTTRNAVIGKAHRLKLAGRVQPRKPEKQKKQVVGGQAKEDRYISRRARFKSLSLLFEKSPKTKCSSQFKAPIGSGLPAKKKLLLLDRKRRLCLYPMAKWE